MRQLSHKKLIPKPILFDYHSPIVNCNLFLLAHQLTNSKTHHLINLQTQKLTNSLIHQLTNSSTYKLKNPKTHQLKTVPTQKLTNLQHAALKPGSYKKLLTWAHIPIIASYDVLNNNPAAELQSWKVIMAYLIGKRTDAEN